MTTTRPLSYANIASTLALVLALGGGGAAVAAGVAKNSVGSKQIKAGAVKAVDLAPDAVDASKIADDSVTGADVAESSLGKVPAAASADSALTAAKATTADEAANVLFAVVAADGTLAKGSGPGITSTRTTTGTYAVKFGRNVSQCASQASAGKIGNGVAARNFFRTAGLDLQPDGIYVDSVDTSFTAADGGFVLTVIC